MSLLFFAAVAPIIALCFFIYSKDRNKEPKNLLTSIFILGVISVIPVLICETAFDFFFPMDANKGFIHIFINVFFGVALIEEFFKWIVIKVRAYDSKDFDEIYDIIVYSVFSSLGFACVENVLYVFSNGFGTAFMRAITAVPGHTCFAVIMGYFLSKAKVSEMNQNTSLMQKNMIYSILVPTAIHSLYDTILLYIVNAEVESLFGYFCLFLFALFVVCIGIVNRISKIQSNVLINVNQGNIVYQDGNISMNTMQINREALLQAASSQLEQKAIPSAVVPNYCPICGKPAKGSNYCGFCGYKLRE